MRVEINDLSGQEIAKFLDDHLTDMRATSPPESKHALDLDDLRRPDVTFWTVRDGDRIVGCGALKALDAGHAEIKSMRTGATHRGRGVASTMLRHILAEARARGFTRLSLETGSMDFFAPARALYAKHGFQVCEPFGDYREDPNSVFMTLRL